MELRIFVFAFCLMAGSLPAQALDDKQIIVPLSDLTGQVIDIGAKDGIVVLNKRSGERHRTLQIDKKKLLGAFTSRYPKEHEALVKALREMFDQEMSNGTASQKATFVNAHIERLILQRTQFICGRVASLPTGRAVLLYQEQFDSESDGKKASDVEKEARGHRMVDPMAVKAEALTLEPDDSHLYVALPAKAVGVYPRVFLGFRFTSEIPNQESTFPSLDEADIQARIRTREADLRAEQEARLREAQSRNLSGEQIAQLKKEQKKESDDLRRALLLERQARLELQSLPSWFELRVDNYFWSGEAVLDEDRTSFMREVKPIRSDFHFLKAVSVSQQKLNIDDGTKDGHNRYLDGDGKRPEPWQFNFKLATVGNGIIFSDKPAMLYSEENGLRFSSERLDEESNISLRYKAFLEPRRIFRKVASTTFVNFQTDQDFVRKRVVAGFGLEYDLENLKRLTFTNMNLGRRNSAEDKANQLKQFFPMAAVADRARIEIGFYSGWQLSDYGRNAQDSSRRVILDLSGTLKLPPINLGAIFRTGSLKASLGVEVVGVYHFGENRTFDDRRRRFDDEGVQTTGPYKDGTRIEGGWRATVQIPFSRDNGVKITYSTYDKENQKGTPELRRFKFEIVSKF